jgi:RNA polymerase sigma-70 factor (ECF subfamily)
MVRLAKRRLHLAHASNCALDAEDVVQNAFVKITKYIKSVNIDVSEKELKSYVLSIVANAVNDFLKKQTDVENLDDYLNTQGEDNFVEDLMIHEQYERVVAMIEQMDEKYRLVLLYRFSKGYQIKQIAELLDVPEKTVYTRISRAQKILREMVKKER